MRVGTVVELWRYPVKSMQGEPLEAVTVGPRGIVGDRGWAVVDVTTGLALTGRRAPDLLFAHAAIVGDDVIMTGGTLLANVAALKERGVKDVWVFATHGLFSGNALERFEGSDLAGIVVTDTVPIDPRHRPANLTVLSVSGLLAETIMNVFADDSVSAIFGGENQLF